MIITKVIILYFIQIKHTDDFPSTGTHYMGHSVSDSQSMVSESLLMISMRFGTLADNDITSLCTFSTIREAVSEI